MRRIKSKGMKPELAVRRLAHRLGYRFRLHRKDLPGSPDLVFPGRRKVIFVHGCFWHQHSDPACRDGKAPRSNNEYWTPKLARNVERDRDAERELRARGWDVLTLWECEVAKDAGLAGRLQEFLDSPPTSSAAA